MRIIARLMGIFDNSHQYDHSGAKIGLALTGMLVSNCRPDIAPLLKFVCDEKPIIFLLIPVGL